MASISTNLTKNALKDLQFYHKCAAFNYPESHYNIICIFTQIYLSEVRHLLQMSYPVSAVVCRRMRLYELCCFECLSLSVYIINLRGRITIFQRIYWCGASGIFQRLICSNNVVILSLASLFSGWPRTYHHHRFDRRHSCLLRLDRDRVECCQC